VTGFLKRTSFPVTAPALSSSKVPAATNRAVSESMNYAMPIVEILAVSFFSPAGLYLPSSPERWLAPCKCLLNARTGI